MHELVHHSLHTKLLSSLRLPSFAGNGLPERMRTISFALLGLTAAAGLALVAIFAQPGFPLLSPAPLPAEPSARESVSAAKKLPLDHGSAALLTALPVPAHPQEEGAGSKPGRSGETSGTGGPVGGSQAPVEVDVPAPVGGPQPSGGSSGGKAGSGAGGSAPPATPEQQVASPSAPASSSPPSSENPEAVASSPQPEPAPAPGNSASAAAAEHASERGVEASAGAGPPASTAATGAPAAPEPSLPPGEAGGLAKGNGK
ncbi:MAG TPA: hypothetical protein VFN82_03395 [Solirubrobacterales bacterium]|nr:hypothetical protein [Solirubrobacterales bacterium]